MTDYMAETHSNSTGDGFCAKSPVVAGAKESTFTTAQTIQWLWGIICVAVVVRIIAALIMGNQIETLPGIYDQVSYDTLARRVTEGHGFTFPIAWWPATKAGEPTAHWSYLYTLYLATVYSLFGTQPLMARLIQATVFGLAGPWLAFRLGNRLFGPIPGLLSAASMAVYGYFVYYSVALVTETFYILAVLAAIYLAMHLVERPSWRDWALLGLMLGLATLLRQLILLFVPFLLLWIVWAGRGRVKFRDLIVPCAVILALILPWTIRNYRAFGHFVLLNTNAGFAFYWANHPIHGTDFIPILTASEPSYGELLPGELLDLDEAALDGTLLRRAIGFIAEDPARYALLSISRGKEYFKFWPSADSSVASNVSRVASFGLFLPFMLYGLLLSLSNWRRCSLLYLFIGVYTLIHLLSWTLIRYRLPIDAILLIFAGLAIADLQQRLCRPKQVAKP